jgi:hypothetical protein
MSNPHPVSRKGRPNKATERARQAIAVFVEDNTERLQGWLDEIAASDGPKAAFMCFSDLIEYHVPKLTRTELAGDPDNPLTIQTIERVIVHKDDGN